MNFIKMCNNFRNLDPEFLTKSEHVSRQIYGFLKQLNFLIAQQNKFHFF